MSLRVSGSNPPPEEDHGLRMRVFLEHHAEEGGAGGEDELVGAHHVPVTHLRVEVARVEG